MKTEPSAPVRLLRPFALVSALAIGGLLIVQAQRRAQPTDTGVAPQASTGDVAPGSAASTSGDAAASTVPDVDASEPFLSTSKSLAPADVVPVEEGARDPFLFSSKSAANVSIRPPLERGDQTIEGGEQFLRSSKSAGAVKFTPDGDDETFLPSSKVLVIDPDLVRTPERPAPSAPKKEQ